MTGCKLIEIDIDHFRKNYTEHFNHFKIVYDFYHLNWILFNFIVYNDFTMIVIIVSFTMINIA